MTSDKYKKRMTTSIKAELFIQQMNMNTCRVSKLTKL